jgi:[ribosomal protein S18]-alanine N-acetyltransferase
MPVHAPRPGRFEPAVIEIRPFLRRHLDRILVIENACFARDAYPRELFLELHRECARHFFVALKSRRIVGYAVASVGEGDAEIVSIAVLPEHRRAGVATALLRHTISRLRRAGVGRLALMVRPENLAALRFYRGLGFRVAGRITRYYEDRSDGLLMRKRL